MTLFRKRLEDFQTKLSADVKFLNQKINDTSIAFSGLVYEYLKPRVDLVEEKTLWHQAFWGTTKIADYKENALCTVPSDWREMRIEYKLKNSTQSEFVMIYNDIQSRARKAYSLGQGVADIVMETDGQLKCFSVTEPNVRILGVFWR